MAFLRREKEIAQLELRAPQQAQFQACSLGGMYNPNVPGFYATGFNGYVVQIGGDQSLFARPARSGRRFSKHQVNILEELFRRTHFPGYTERMRLAVDFAMEETRIQVWFKNRRSKFRAQEKKNVTQEFKCEEAAQAATMPAQGNDFVTNSTGGVFELADGPPPTLSSAGFDPPANPDFSTNRTPYPCEPAAALPTASAGLPIPSAHFYDESVMSFFNYIPLMQKFHSEEGKDGEAPRQQQKPANNDLNPINQ